MVTFSPLLLSIQTIIPFERKYPHKITLKRNIQTRPQKNIKREIYWDNNVFIHDYSNIWLGISSCRAHILFFGPYSEETFIWLHSIQPVIISFREKTSCNTLTWQTKRKRKSVCWGKLKWENHKITNWYFFFSQRNAAPISLNIRNPR